jgi:pantoate--beta-alanine ligase
LCSTFRDKNKVALSSRNYLLDVKDLNVAGFIAKILIKLKLKLRNNKKKNNLLVTNIKKEIIEKYKVKIDYLEVRNVTNLKTNLKNKRYKIFIAYFLNKIRLIDNF